MADSPRGACPAPEQLVALAEGALPDPVAEPLREHARTCGPCAQRLVASAGCVDERTSDVEMTAALAGAAQRRAAPAPTLVEGSRVGRYTVLEKLGEGGMGVVYAAYDAELHRKVALKLLHEHGVLPEAASLGRARLLREAQALARLSHPNVVGVHEVGTFEGTVFMAMEFVEGKTLRAWLKEAPRRWSEVLPIFIEAGRGLKAAHDKGLIHRDFKPDNVLLGTDGRVRVLDFGLARGEDAPGPELEVPAGAPGSSSESFSSPLTQQGRVVGTIPYLAPELLAGGQADVRTDLFAFCVSLYEALYGARPFAKPRDALGPPPEPPKGTHVPAWLRRVVLKGLLPDSRGRYQDFAALLVALESDPWPPLRRRLVAGALLAGVALAVTGSYRLASQHSQLCRTEGERLRGVWDAQTTQGLQAAFVRAGVPMDTFERTRRALDDYASQLVQQRTEACVDTRVKGRQPDSVLMLRMQCLDRRLGELKAFTEVLTQGSAAMLTDAVKSTAKLTGLDICANVAALKAPVPLPEAPAARRQVLDGQAKLARAHLAQHAPAKALAEFTEAEALVQRAQADPALLAQARFAMARALWEGGGDKERALALARQARADFAQSETRAADERAALAAWLRARAS